MRSTNVAASVIVLAFGAAGCAHEEAPSVDVSAVTCPPHIDHYPVAGPYNGGYDPAWNDFRCDGSLNNSDYGGDHHGNDVFAPRGTPIVAPVDGVVTRSGTASSTSGLRVTVADGCGWSYYHGHMDSIAGGIVVGAHVRAGDVLGTLGDTGTTGTAPHLHFNVHRDGDYANDTDPFPVLQPARATACGPDPQCVGRGDGSFCADATHLASCTGGRYASGDCGAFGTACDALGGGTRCAPHLDGAFVGSDFPGGTRIEVRVGREVRGCLTYRNTGSWSWVPGTTNLGTSEPRDRASAFPGSDWPSASRLGTISAPTATGATGTFCFSLHGAGTPGERVERFSLVHDGFFWAADTGGVSDATNFLTVVTVAAPIEPMRPMIPSDAAAGEDASVVDDAGTRSGDAAVSRPDARVGASDGGLATHGPRPSISGGCSVVSAGSAGTGGASFVALVAIAAALRRRRVRANGG